MVLKITPNPDAPSAIKVPTRRERMKLLESHAVQIGRLVYSWNKLQEELAQLFVVCCKPAQEHISSAIWYSSKSDLAQREMLRAVVERRAFKQQPEAKAEILWTLQKINHSLADKRNDVIHAPFVFLTDAFGTRFTTDIMSGNPRAHKLRQKELMAEFRWYRLTADALGDYVRELRWAIETLDFRTLPNRPTLPSHGQMRLPNRKIPRRKPSTKPRPRPRS